MHMTISGIHGYDSIVEYQAPMIKNFRMFCESIEEAHIGVKQLMVDTLLMDLTSDEPMTPEERESIARFYEKMSGGLDL